MARVGDELRLDPSPEEEAVAGSGHGFVFSFKGKASEPDCVGIESVGSFDEDEVNLLILRAQGVIEHRISRCGVCRVANASTLGGSGPGADPYLALRFHSCSRPRRRHQPLPGLSMLSCARVLRCATG